MFSITGEENLPVLVGLAVGGGLSLMVLFVLGFTGFGGSPRYTATPLLGQAVTTMKDRLGALVTLWIGVSLAYTAVTLFALLIGRTTTVFETAMAAVLVFLGHRTMLERPAAAAGIDVPQTGYWSILLRSLALGALILVTAGLVFVLAALMVALAEMTGLDGETARLAAGVAAGIAAICLSTLFARLAFVYPSSVLGGRDWFGTALGRTAPVAMALSASLWLVALVSIGLIIPVVIGSNSLVLSAMAALPATPGDLPDDIGTPLFWLRLVVEELPLNLLLVAYSLASIACVSAAYRITVLEPATLAPDR
ncbi:hypothetical protein [Maricaulis sp.]|uniref:hypothetical protein n=1 Tax=Maricaulis sp. TaxID=1486257 RepID=UPI002B26FC47|nr:hypothetical protein [Maricaulis sp.]